MEVNKKGNDIDLNFISKVLDSLNRPKDFAVIHPVKIRHKHKIYKLQKSGSLANKSINDSVAMACKESDKKESLLLTDNSLQNNSFHPVNDGCQQSSSSGDNNGSSSAGFSNDVMNNPSSFCESTFDHKYEGRKSDKPTQQQISYKVTSEEHVTLKTFADCTKALSNKLSGPLDCAEPYQKKKENTTSENNKPYRIGKSSKISHVKKMVLPKNKCGHHDGSGLTLQQFEHCDETALATIPMKRAKQKVPEIVETGEFGRAASPSTVADILSLTGSKALGPVVPSSASPDIPAVKSLENTMVDGNAENKRSLTGSKALGPVVPSSASPDIPAVKSLVNTMVDGNAENKLSLTGSKALGPVVPSSASPDIPAVKSLENTMVDGNAENKLSLTGSKTLGPVVPSSVSPDIPALKSLVNTMVDGNAENKPKTISVSVKSASKQKKRKRTYNHLNKESPRMSRRQRYDQLVANPCMNTVNRALKIQNSDTSTIGLSNEDKINVVPENISVDSKQTDCKSELISHKKDSAISLLGCNNTSLDNIFKSDQLTKNLNFSGEFGQHEICTKLSTPSKCVVLLPEELRESTDKSAAVLSGNSLTTHKCEAIHNLDVVLSQKRSQDLSPANMSPVRLSKDVVSSPVRKSLSAVRHVEPNEKTSVSAEWKQTGHYLPQTLNSASSETVLEDQTLEANSDLNVSVLPFSVLFPNTTFSNSSEGRSLSLIFDDEKTIDTPTGQIEILKSSQGVSMSEECENSGASAEGSVSSCLINSSNDRKSNPPALDDFRNSITSQTNSRHVAETSTTPAFQAEELPVRPGTQTSTEEAMGTPHISPNYAAALSLHTSSEEHSGNGDDCCLDKSCASVGADPVNDDEDDLSGCIDSYMKETDCLAGVEATRDSAQPETSHAAEYNGACSNSVSLQDSSCEDKALSPVVAEKVTKCTSFPTTSRKIKFFSNDQCVSEEIVSSSLSTIHWNPTIQKPGIQTKPVKKVRQGKTRTASLTAIKNVDKMTSSEYIKPKKNLKSWKNLKDKKSIGTRNLHENVENGKNCTTFQATALVHAHVDQYCSPEKLCRPTHNPPLLTGSDQPCMPKLHEPPLNVLVHAESDQHCTPEKEFETPQNELVHAHSDEHRTQQKLHKTRQIPLSSDTRSGIVFRSAPKSAPDHLPAALNNHNPLLQTSLIPFKSGNEQESSSLYWFSEVATTYAYGAASSADLQRLDCVPENKLQTNASKEIQDSPELTSSLSNITRDINTESVNICNLATTNLPSTDVTGGTNTSPCNTRTVKNSSKLSVASILRTENCICESDQTDGTENLRKKNIPSTFLQNRSEHQDTLHNTSTQMRHPCITSLFIADDDDRDFEGFKPSDMVKKVQSATNSFDQPNIIGVENLLPTLVASDEKCCDTATANGIKRSSYKRTKISKRKRNLRGSSLSNLVIKDRLRSIHKLSPTKVTSRLLNEHTSSYMDTVKKGKVSSLERKIRLQKKSKNVSRTINPVVQIEEESNKRSFPKSSILAPVAMNNANANVSPTSSPSSTTTTSITGSSERKKTCIQNSQTFIAHNIGTFDENQPSIFNNKNISIENSLHKSTNTSFDKQEHNDNHLDAQPDAFPLDITCNKTAKGCTVRCRDPRSDPPGTPYQCLTCSINNSYHSLVSLLQHIMVVHANAPPASVGDSDGSSLMPADCVDSIASRPHWVESGQREASEQTPLIESDCKRRGWINGASNGHRDDEDECSEAVDSGSDRSKRNAKESTSQPGASDCSPRSKNNDEVSPRSSDKKVVTRQENDHCDSLVKQSEAGICNGNKKDIHSMEMKRKKTSDLKTRRSENGDMTRNTIETIDRNQRKNERDDANKRVDESDDVTITVNDAIREKITSAEVSENNDQFKTFAAYSKRSRSSDGNSKKSVTLNFAKIVPINSTSNNTLFDTADVKHIIKLNSPEGDNNCDRKQRSTKRKRRAGRKSKKDTRFPVKVEYKPPPMVMNPCRPRKGFIVIPTMTPDDVERLLSVQRKAFNETFKMKRREIIANNKEAGIDVSKQLVMVDGTKRYQCEKCTTSVSTVPLLLNHMVTHYSAELAEFSCAFCPKTFRYGSALKLHLEKHGDMMKFFCPICKLGFQQEAKLRYHIMLHAQKKRTVFGCKKCDKKFSSTALLAGHSKVHYPDLKYRCRECDFVCIGRGGLSKHVKAEHRKQRAKKVKLI